MSKKIVVAALWLTALSTPIWADQLFELNKIEYRLTTVPICRAVADAYFSYMELRNNDAAEKNLEDVRACVAKAGPVMQQGFRKLDTKLTSPEAKKALREHFIASKVLLEAAIPEVGDRRKKYESKYDALEQ